MARFLLKRADMRTSLGFLLAAALAACGDVRQTIDASMALDASTIDATDPPADGPVDAAVDSGLDAPPPLPGQELTGAGGRITSPTFVMDVQLGHAITQPPTQSATFRLEPSTAIKP